VLELLAESIDEENPERMALDLFDRLRLREPFADAFGALGFEGEEGWRVAARIKVVLLSEAGIGKEASAASATPIETAEDAVAVSAFDTESPAAASAPEEPAAPEAKPAEVERVALSPALWADPDVRWLTGVHEAKGHAYLIREHYEELLWWLLMPSLLKLAGAPVLDRSAIKEMGKIVDEALASAEAAGYRIDALLSPPAQPEEAEAAEPELETQSVEPEETNDETVNVSSSDSADPVDSVNYAERVLRKPSK
jgi:hypothetical protein